VHKVHFRLLLLVSCLPLSTLSSSLGEESITKINGVPLFCETVGKGEAIVVLHGGPGLDHTYLLPQMLGLAKTHRLILCDQRGTGKSDVAIDPSFISLSNFVEDIEGVRKVYGLEKMNLLGHSWGGNLAMFYAVRYPQNLKSLILVDASAASVEMLKMVSKAQQEHMSPEDRTAFAELIKSDGFKENKTEIIEEFFRIVFHSSFYDPKKVDQLTLQFSDLTAKNWARIPSLLFQGMESFDITAQLSKVEAPTLIIQGDSDPIPMEIPQKLHTLLKNSNLVMLPQCGHFPFIEAPAPFFKSVSDFVSAQN
jgi:proline iminopeptidase